jgi:glycopeptide antibiotics resistance protein
MLEIPFITLELLFTAVWLAVRLIVWIRQKRIIWKREALLLLMYINLAVIIRFAFFPRALVNGHIQPLIFDAKAAFPFRINIVPFVNLLQYDSTRDIIWNVVGNTALFIPSGIILPIVYHKLNTFGKVIAAGAIISLFIEVIQLPFTSRVTDIDDLILNTLGVMIGYGIYSFVKSKKDEILQHRS